MSLPGGAQSSNHYTSKQILAQTALESPSYINRLYTKENNKAATGSPIPTPKIILYNGILKDQWPLKRVGSGLVNMGNTCFLASVLQSLSHIPMFYNYVLTHVSTTDCKEFCIVCITKSFLELSFSNSSPIKPSIITSNLLKIAEHMVIGEQEDAHDFLLSFLNAFQKRLVPSRWINDDFIANTSAIGQIFNGYLRSQIICQTCKEASNTYESTFNLSLEIKGLTSLEAALKNFFKADVMGDELWYNCSRCCVKTKAFKKYSLEVLPKVLIFQFNRYEFGPYGRVKITDKVNYSRYIDMGRYLSGNSDGDGSRYRLHAVTVHRGSQMGSGHYLSCVAHPRLANVQNGTGDCKKNSRKVYKNLSFTSTNLNASATPIYKDTHTSDSKYRSFQNISSNENNHHSTLKSHSTHSTTRGGDASSANLTPPRLLSPHPFTTSLPLNHHTPHSTTSRIPATPSKSFSSKSSSFASFSPPSSNTFHLPSKSSPIPTTSNHPWFYMNDEMVTETSWESVCTEQAYLLFYIKDNNINNNDINNSSSDINNNKSNMKNKSNLKSKNNYNKSSNVFRKPHYIENPNKSSFNPLKKFKHQSLPKQQGPISFQSTSSTSTTYIPTPTSLPPNNLFSSSSSSSSLSSPLTFTSSSSTSTPFPVIPSQSISSKSQISSSKCIPLHKSSQNQLIHHSATSPLSLPVLPFPISSSSISTTAPTLSLPLKSTSLPFTLKPIYSSSYSSYTKTNDDKDPKSDPKNYRKRKYIDENDGRHRHHHHYHYDDKYDSGYTRHEERLSRRSPFRERESKHIKREADCSSNNKKDERRDRREVVRWGKYQSNDSYYYERHDSRHRGDRYISKYDRVDRRDKKRNDSYYDTKSKYDDRRWRDEYRSRRSERSTDRSHRVRHRSRDRFRSRSKNSRKFR